MRVRNRIDIDLPSGKRCKQIGKKHTKQTCNFVLWRWNQRVNVLPLEYISSQQMCNFLWGVERSENIERDVKKINGAEVLSKFGFESQGGTL